MWPHLFLCYYYHYYYYYYLSFLNFFYFIIFLLISSITFYIILSYIEWWKCSSSFFTLYFFYRFNNKLIFFITECYIIIDISISVKNDQLRFSDLEICDPESIQNNLSLSLLIQHFFSCPVFKTTVKSNSATAVVFSSRIRI